MSELQTSIAALRKSYERAELDETASQADPLQQFDRWLNEAIAAQVPEPNAMTLATVGPDLRPSTRIVLIKGYDARGVVWYTNYDSRKGQQLAGNPFAALQFHWVELERVVLHGMALMLLMVRWLLVRGWLRGATPWVLGLGAVWLVVNID